MATCRRWGCEQPVFDWLDPAYCSVDHRSWAMHEAANTAVEKMASISAERPPGPLTAVAKLDGIAGVASAAIAEVGEISRSPIGAAVQPRRGWLRRALELLR